MEDNNQPAASDIDSELMQALRAWLANLEARARVLAELQAAASGR